MNITQSFLSFTLLGAEWVLWLLIVLSVLSIAVAIERFRYFAARTIDTQAVIRDVQAAIKGDSSNAFRDKYARVPAMAAVVALEGLEESEYGVDATAEAMNSAKTQVRAEHERNLVVLGTLGNNAPFIGLFGTVLGIIKAFNDLAENPSGDATVVMGGISEALVATAVGLLVAIPAVILFNYFNRRVRAAVVAADAVAHAILGAMHGAEEGQG